MDSAIHLARVLPEMARAARNSALTVDALYTLLAGLRTSLKPGEASDHLRRALQHLESLKRGLPAEHAQASFAIVEDACARIASFLTSDPTATPAPSPSAGFLPVDAAKRREG